jgi:type IV pilus assembly protein PilC
MINLGQQLPLSTRALVVLAHLITNYWYVVVAIPFAVAGAFWWTLHTSPSAAHWFDGVKLRLPLVGPLLERVILSRFARVFGLMYASGITVLEAIGITRDVAGNRVIANAIAEAGQLISQGQNISGAFQQVRLFPPLVLRMLAVGETTGALDVSLANVSYFYDREVRERIARLQAMIEPAMTVILGAILLAILVPLFGPMYDMIAKIKA